MREEKIAGLGRSLARARTRAALAFAFTLVLVSSLTYTSWAKPRFKTLHTFTQTGAAEPTAALVADRQGNLYGTTAWGGAHNQGTVFKLAPDGHGWSETVLHSFKRSDGRGRVPFGGLIFDATGNLYGTTLGGGVNDVGTVFELEPDGHGGWNETVLHKFQGLDGYMPQAALIFDATGNLYGTTWIGGASGDGTVFELAPDGHGGWNEAVLHSFNGTDGFDLAASLIFDADGNLYGTTEDGGVSHGGTVFELAPDGHGGWNETALHSFKGTDGAGPAASLIFDADGNLYGTTQYGGASDWGKVFELSPDGHGGWTETVLHSFNSKDGQSPFAGLVFDADGNLYGTTFLGGAFGWGTVFELSPDGHGGWKETVLHSFKNRPGARPLGTLIFGPQGHLYGTTNGDGRTTFGSVFEIAP